MKFKAWHGECSSHAEADVVEAENVDAVAKKLLFQYYAGDCDRGADTVKQLTDATWLATRKDSPDYFYIAKEQ